jgi:broad specificity phosphatase PhoE
VRDRFVPFIDSLIQQRRDTDANLLCIGHGGLYWMMLPLALKNIDPQFISKQQGFGHTALIISQLEPQGLICREWDGVKIGA